MGEQFAEKRRKGGGINPPLQERNSHKSETVKAWQERRGKVLPEASRGAA